LKKGIQTAICCPCGNEKILALGLCASVPFTHGAVGAGNGIGTPNNADHQITLFEPADWVSFQDAAERFVAKYEACFARRRPSVFPFDNLDVGTADPDRDRSNIRLRDVAVRSVHSLRLALRL